MPGSGTTLNLRGSEWHRWDPHLHAPGTLLNDQFGGDWESYLKRIELDEPPVHALGVTDYFCIQTYREVCRRKAEGRLPAVGLVFPNVEMRLDVKTQRQKAINIHFLFSPDDPNHQEEIQRILGLLTFEFQEKTYRCTLSELAALGRAFNPKQLDELNAVRNGANQFKVTLQALRQLFRAEAWLRKNCLVAVAGGLGDGTAGLQEDASFSATRQEIERFAHIIFASTPGQREFWLGKKTGKDRSFIEQMYGCLKPCLHGSDAHREANVVNPDLDRYCWIKGDLTFETLRQAVIEPEDRVWIGPTAAPHDLQSISIRRLDSAGTPWLKTATIELNPGLVAVIGARGSGKTALVEIVAAGASSPWTGLGESSFLKRASSPIDYLENASVELTWADDSRRGRPLRPPRDREAAEDDTADVCYLSQHFVEKLCSSAGLAVELRREMERVVFDATDPTERMETDSFEDLASVLLEPIRQWRQEIQISIQSTTEKIVQEDHLRDRLTAMRKEREALIKNIITGRNDLGLLLPKGKEERARQLVDLDQLCSKAEANVETLRRRQKAIQDLSIEIAHTRTHTEPARFAEMRRRFTTADLAEADWAAFGMKFTGDVDAVVNRAKIVVEAAIKTATDGDPGNPIDTNKTPGPDWPLQQLRTKRNAVKSEVGIDAQQQKKYEELQRSVAKQDATLRRLQLEIDNAEGADARRQQLIDSRREAYAKIFETIVEEETILKSLYGPLSKELMGAGGALAKLEFVVQRRIDLKGWVEAGEQLLDLRKASVFQGHGALLDVAKEYLMPAWSRGTAGEVAIAMDGFRLKYQRDLINAMPASVPSDDRRVWGQSVAAWLISRSLAL
jgi:energy-coupling factor transporter ATP-binding protein EcfA2